MAAAGMKGANGRGRKAAMILVKPSDLICLIQFKKKKTN